MTPEPPRKRSWLEKYQYWIVGVLCAAALVYEFSGAITATPPSQQLAATGMMVFLEAAYDDDAALAADMAALDNAGSDENAAVYLMGTIYPRLYEAYREALVNAPAAPLEENYRLTMEMIRTAHEQAPQICAAVLELDANFDIMSDELPADLIEKLSAGQKARYKALAGIIRAARETPSPLEVPVEKAVLAYEMAFGRSLNQQNKQDLLERAMQQQASDAETCTLITLAASSAQTVPDYQRLMVLKGMMLAPYVQQPETPQQ